MANNNTAFIQEQLRVRIHAHVLELLHTKDVERRRVLRAELTDMRNFLRALRGI